MPRPAFTWEDVDALRVDRHIPIHAFTATEYRKQYKISDSTARRELIKMDEEGKLTSASVIRDGKRVRVYWVAS